jgi:hypothetical protein
VTAKEGVLSWSGYVIPFLTRCRSWIHGMKKDPPQASFLDAIHPQAAPTSLRIFPLEAQL